MPRRILLLSGPVASGKTALAESLCKRYGIKLFKTRELIRSLTGVEHEREALQLAGERLDRSKGGRWLATALARDLEDLEEQYLVLVDSVRTESQVEAVRAAFGPTVVHVHLTAPDEELEARYSRRSAKIRELPSYDAVRANRTEKRVSSLARIADIVVDTGRCQAKDVVVRVAAQVGLYGKGLERLVDVVIGGEFGSEGKGHIASFLAPEYDVLVRVGGPNAGHTVYEEPSPYTFHHLPSGTRRCPEKAVVLGPGAVLCVEELLAEVAECGLTEDRLSIDPQALVIEEEDREQERRGLVEAIASTGRGVGAATARKVLRVATPPVRLAGNVKQLAPFIRESLPIFERAFSDGRRVLLEGTQGTGLSLHHGYYPYVTSRDTTVGGCLAEAGIAPSRVRRIVMVCRTYPIRVEGESGPLGCEIGWDVVAARSGLDLKELLEVEKTSTTRRRRRVGEFDWSLLRKAASLNGPTDIALTFADYLSKKNRRARRFEQLTAETIRFIEEVERVTVAPVSLIATRFHSRGIIDRRSW